jgi:hypothetical protein
MAALEDLMMCLVTERKTHMFCIIAPKGRRSVPEGMAREDKTFPSKPGHSRAKIWRQP